VNSRATSNTALANGVDFWGKLTTLAYPQSQPTGNVQSHLESSISPSACPQEGRDYTKGGTSHDLKGVELPEHHPEMLFHFIPVSSSLWYPSEPPLGDRLQPWEMENPNLPLKTLALKLLALLLEIVVIVIVNHKEKKDKSILVGITVLLA